MTQPYSSDLRERVVRAHLAGEPIPARWRRVSVSASPRCRSGPRASGRQGVWPRAGSAVTAPGSWSRIGRWFTGRSPRRRI